MNLRGLLTDEPPPWVVVSFGFGVDSAGILLRWLTDPTSRDFDLSDLVVVSAMTGDEWGQTGRDVTDHVLPLLREHGVRFVQVGRDQRRVGRDGSGVVVLDDSRSPTRLYIEGAYKLSDEMLEAGTVPQSGGARLCSVHAKGDPLDVVIAQLTKGQPYRHVIGYEVNEMSRVVKDRRFDTKARVGEYPLVEWGWDRATTHAYVLAQTGVDWIKSACTFCPFALATTAGRRQMLARYEAEPAAGVFALVMEHLAMALNPSQSLIPGDPLVGVMRRAGLHGVLAAFADELARTEHAVYDVRRVLHGRRDDPTKVGSTARSLRIVARGPRAEMVAERVAFERTPHAITTGGGPDGHLRTWLLERGRRFPTREHFRVVAPIHALPKDHRYFDRWWARLDVAQAS